MIVSGDDEAVVALRCGQEKDKLGVAQLQVWVIAAGHEALRAVCDNDGAVTAAAPQPAYSQRGGRGRLGSALKTREPMGEPTRRIVSGGSLALERP